MFSKYFLPPGWLKKLSTRLVSPLLMALMMSLKYSFMTTKIVVSCGKEMLVFNDPKGSFPGQTPSTLKNFTFQSCAARSYTRVILNLYRSYTELILNLHRISFLSPSCQFLCNSLSTLYLPLESLYLKSCSLYLILLPFRGCCLLRYLE
jgi:hypothetical protein